MPQPYQATKRFSNCHTSYRHDLARRISNRLILKHEINSFSGLSEFLEVDCNFNNQQAVRCWVRNEIDEGLDINQEPYEQIEKKLISITPRCDED